MSVFRCAFSNDHVAPPSVVLQMAVVVLPHTYPLIASLKSRLVTSTVAGRAICVQLAPPSVDLPTRFVPELVPMYTRLASTARTFLIWPVNGVVTGVQFVPPFVVL